MLKYKLIIFDLDGVLLDSRQNMQVAWAAVQSAIQTDIGFERYFSEIGKPFSDIMEELGLGAKAREAEKAYMTTSIANSNLLHWFHGVETMLVGLVEIDAKLAIVTSKDRQRTVRLVEQLPVYFSTIQTPAQGLRGKPAPDHLMIACANANVDPYNALFVGDMVVDQQAAMRANIDFAHAAWGYGAVDQGKAFTLKHPNAILETVMSQKL